VDREIVVGRDHCDLELEDSQVSRRHAVIRPVERGIVVEDLGSTNGTIVEGERISEPVTLASSNASIVFGQTELELILDFPEPEATQRQETPTDMPAAGGAATGVSAQGAPSGPALERKLRVIWGPAAGHSLSVEQEVVIGREGADLTILDPELSRRHAAVRPVPNGVEIEDLGSTNGTWVNGERIDKPVTLATSGKLQLGTTEIQVELLMPGATRLGGRPHATDQRTRIAASLNPMSAVALQEAEAEQVEAEADQVAPAPEPPAADTQMSQAARRLGITEENRRWWALAAMCLGLAMISLDTTVINVALPTIQRELNTGLSGLQWTVNAYTLTLAVLLVTGGRLGDLFGRKRCFLTGVVIFAGASMVCGAAPSDRALIAARAVQGVGAALMMPATLSILGSVFPPEERGKAIGIWAGVSGIALAIGPVVGGLLTQDVSWRAVFYINAPVALAAIAITLVSTPESRDEHAEPGLDVPGNLLLIASLFALILALIKGPDWGWLSPATIGLLAGSVIGLLLFVIVETNVKAPMLDFSALSAPPYIGANLAGFAGFFVMLSMLVYVAIYMQSILGYDALQAGYRFLPGTLLVAVAAPTAGRLVGRILPRYLMAIGLVLVAAAALVITRITPDTGYGLLVPSMVLIGLGIGTTLPPMSVTALFTVRRGKAGLGSGVLQMNRQLGAAFGVAIVGSLFQSLTRSNIKDNLASLQIPEAQKSAISNAALSGSAPSVGSLNPAVVPKVGHAVGDAVVSALAAAMWVPVVVALVGAVAVLVMIDRPKARVPAKAASVPVR
jgi:EmrB/QacA subfamily drug resistance transporter